MSKTSSNPIWILYGLLCMQNLCYHSSLPKASRVYCQNLSPLCDPATQAPSTYEAPLRSTIRHFKGVTNKVFLYSLAESAMVIRGGDVVSFSTVFMMGLL